MVDRFNFYNNGQYECGTLCVNGDFVHYDKYAELRARIAELETVEHLEKQQLQEEKDSLTLALSKAVKRIAELEAAQQWHPASEPPEQNGSIFKSRTVEVQSDWGGVQSDFYDYQNGCWYFSTKPNRWRDLPPLEVKESL
jgi:hypothetical protein